MSVWNHVWSVNGCCCDGQGSEVISMEGWDGESDLTSGVWGVQAEPSSPSTDRKAVSKPKKCKPLPQSDIQMMEEALPPFFPVGSVCQPVRIKKKHTMVIECLSLAPYFLWHWSSLNSKWDSWTRSNDFVKWPKLGREKYKRLLAALTLFKYRNKNTGWSPSNHLCHTLFLLLILIYSPALLLFHYHGNITATWSFAVFGTACSCSAFKRKCIKGCKCNINQLSAWLLWFSCVMTETTRGSIKLCLPYF